MFRSVWRDTSIQKEGEKITSEDGVPAGYEEITDDFYGPDGHEELLAGADFGY